MSNLVRHSQGELSAVDVPRDLRLRYFATDGGLITYGPGAAGYVDRILKGEKPADLPISCSLTNPTLVIPENYIRAYVDRQRRCADAAARDARSRIAKDHFFFRGSTKPDHREKLRDVFVARGGDARPCPPMFYVPCDGH